MGCSLCAGSHGENVPRSTDPPPCDIATWSRVQLEGRQHNCGCISQRPEQVQSCACTRLCRLLTASAKPYFWSKLRLVSAGLPADVTCQVAEEGSMTHQ